MFLIKSHMWAIFSFGLSETLYLDTNDRSSSPGWPGLGWPMLLEISPRISAVGYEQFFFLLLPFLSSVVVK